MAWGSAQNLGVGMGLHTMCVYVCLSGGICTLCAVCLLYIRVYVWAVWRHGALLSRPFFRPHRCLGSHYQLRSSCLRLHRWAAKPRITTQGVQRRGRDVGGKGRSGDSQRGEAVHNSECSSLVVDRPGGAWICKSVRWYEIAGSVVPVGLTG